MTQGARTKYGIGATSTVDTAFEATSFGLVSSKPHLNANGMRGTRSRIAERTIEGVEEVSGSFTCSPNIIELQSLLPWVGFSEATGTYSLTEALTSRYLAADKVTKVPVYSGCYVGSAVMRAAKNVPWEWTFNVVGQTETDGDAATFPEIDLTEAPPLALHHAVATLLGSARSFEEVTVTIDNALDARSNNAAFNELIEPSDRIITIDLMLPYTAANADLKNQPITGDASASIEFTYGSYYMALGFGNLKFPKGAVEVPGKTGLMLKLSGQAYMTGATRELVIYMTDDN